MVTRERRIRSHSGPDGGTDGGTGGENERRGRHSAPHRPAGADGRRGDAQRRTLDVVEGWTVPVTELSGLGVRTDPRTGARQLLGVGDQDFEVLLGGPTTGWERRVVEVPDPFGPNRHGDGRSNWEAVAGDASGRVFVVPERHHHLLVLDQDLRFELAVTLERPPSWRGGPGWSPSCSCSEVTSWRPSNATR